MHKRILALICTAVLMSNLVSVENWSMITRAEEQEEQPAETEFYPAFTDSVQFAAAFTPDEEYCNDLSLIHI